MEKSKEELQKELDKIRPAYAAMSLAWAVAVYAFAIYGLVRLIGG